MMQGAVGQTGVELYLPDLLGYAGAIGISLLVLFGLYRLTKKYENFRKKEGYFEENVYEESEKKMPSNGENKLFSYRTYHNIFVRRWSFAAGGILLALAIAFIIRTTGHAWGVTGGFTNWGVAFFSLFGVEFTSSAFSGVVKTVENGILYDAISLRNGGMIVGAAIAFLLAGKFKFDKNFTAKDTVYYAVGGIMMGVGARMAGGCNIGALFAGIVNFSLSGWGFMVVMSLGAVVALKLFAGKANTIPPNRY
ncbi:MAG TPA: hypothetical protein DHN33_09530 [Eubacteriaceae bacterium]|nr:hypothetical protein [Eubacteriaceae bacterium]